MVVSERPTVIVESFMVRKPTHGPCRVGPRAPEVRETRETRVGLRPRMVWMCGVLSPAEVFVRRACGAPRRPSRGLRLCCVRMRSCKLSARPRSASARSVPPSREPDSSLNTTTGG
jgi:hypothetical protein